TLQDELTLAEGSEISVSTAGRGDAGTVNVTGGALRITGGGRISSATEGEGEGGNVELTLQDELTLTDAGEISVSTTGRGDAGTVNVTGGALRITGGGRISSATDGAADSGSIVLSLQEELTLADQSEITASTTGQGSAGTVNIRGDALRVASDSRISSTTAGGGEGGNVELTLQDELTLADQSEITASTTGQGGAGTVKVDAEALRIMSDSRISSTTEDEGEGGNVELTLQDELTLADRSEISVSTVGRGDAGTVNVTGGALRITSGSKISSATAGAADSGSIILTLQDELTLAGRGSGLFANTELGSTGDGGNIVVDPALIQLTDEARISVSSLGSGIGGNIDLTANVLSLDNGSRIEAETASTIGGNVTLTINDWVLLSGSSLISVTAGRNQGAGNGGNIDINLANGFLIAEEGTDSDIIARGSEGTGGNIRITARGIYGIVERSAAAGNETNDIDASSQFEGDLTVEPSEANLESPVEAINAAELIDRRCQADAGQGQSSLVVTGRGGLPPDPAQIVRSDGRALTELEFDEVSSDVALPLPEHGLIEATDAASSEAPTRLIEAHTWERNTSGQAVLMASRNSSYRPQNAHPCQ
ncbi:MAG: hypothetical protein AAGB13_09750, partial [Cyanobacteria bacterium P01_F01_bin.33]